MELPAALLPPGQGSVCHATHPPPACLQNVLTDINFFKTDHLPRRRWHGKVVEVHRGECWC